MIVYVETNFLLELAYLQEEHEACEWLLAAAEGRRLELAVPAFSLIEARMSLKRRSRRNRNLAKRVKDGVRELSRSRPHAELPGRTAELLAALIDEEASEQKRLDDTVARLTACATVIPLTDGVASGAARHERELAVSPQDAAVLAAVLVHLARSPAGAKCFLNKNSRDFASPDVTRALGAHECKLFTRFTQGAAFLKHTLGEK